MPGEQGKILKKIRESRHFSLEEASERSRIPKHIISAIEENRLDELKSAFYAKSFVKTYAVFLGALNEQAVKEYLAKGRAVYQQASQKKQDTVLRPPEKTVRQKQIDFSFLIKYKKHVIAVISGIIVLWFLFFTMSLLVRLVKNMPKARQGKAVVIKKEIPKKIENEKLQEPAAEIKKENIEEKNEFIELEVSVSENTWLQITRDGELMFKGSFKKGNKDTWKAKKEIKIEMGNSGAVKISMNGKPLNFTGKRGQKKEIIVTKDGIK